LAIGAISPGYSVVRADGAVTVDIAEARAMYEATIAMHRRLIEAARQGDHAAFDRIGADDLVVKDDAAAMDRLAAIVNTAPPGPADCVRAASLYGIAVRFASTLWLSRRSPEILNNNPPAQQVFANPFDFVAQSDEGLDRAMSACERALGRPSAGRHALGRALVASVPQ
jgi:hypothetical protein